MREERAASAHPVPGLPAVAVVGLGLCGGETATTEHDAGVDARRCTGRPDRAVRLAVVEPEAVAAARRVEHADGLGAVTAPDAQLLLPVAGAEGARGDDVEGAVAPERAGLPCLDGRLGLALRLHRDLGAADGGRGGLDGRTCRCHSGADGERDQAETRCDSLKDSHVFLP